MREIDPDKWNSVPITFKTTFDMEDGSVDIRTIIHIHEALEKEFNIEIKDKHILCKSIEICYEIITLSHEAY